jgi:hypothetical protein
MNPVIIEYDYRSDGGPKRIGPFDTRSLATAHADAKAREGWQAAYCIVPLTPPEEDTH